MESQKSVLTEKIYRCVTRVRYKCVPCMYNALFMSKNFTIPPELRNAICNNNLIVFVGAGTSFKLLNINQEELLGWSNLVKRILDDLHEKGFDVQLLLPLVEKFDPIDVLNLIEKDTNLPKKDVYSFVKEFLDLHEDNNLEIHKKLFQLSRKIITTNYDTAFETAIPALRKHKAYKGKNYEQTTHKDPLTPLLFKLHGCYEDADSMVLFPSNYSDLYENPQRDAEHSLLVLKNIIINKTILFVGTGMGDFQINSLFQEIKKLQGEYNQKHFILTTSQLDSALSFLKPIKLKDFTEIEPYIDHLVALKNEFESQEPEEVIELKQQLEEANKTIEELKNTSNKDKLLKRESLKYFSKGLEFSLNDQPEKASDEYKVAIELNPNFPEALNNWGNSLGNLAKSKSDEEAEKLYNQAFEKYRKAVEIEPDKHEAYYNWGNYLCELAKSKSDEEAEKLYNQAFGKYQKAVEIKPNKHEAYYNWGNYLCELAKSKKGIEAEKLFNEAFEMLQKAVEIKPDKHEAFNNWGSYLGDLAKSKKDSEAEVLFNLAFEKYQKAVEINPKMHEAFNNWGSDLGELAKSKKGIEAEKLMEQAMEKFQLAIEHGGGKSYNLSCLYALKKEKKNALKHLEVSLSNDEIDVEFVLADEDWEMYYQDPDFIALIEKHKRKSQ